MKYILKKQHVLSFLFFVFLAIGIFATPASQTFAATTGSVTATVMTQNVSLSVTDGSINYGTLNANTAKSTITADLNDLQTATNDGNVAEDFNIKGQNSAGWTLAATAGSNQYVHKFCTATCSTPPTNFSALTTSYLPLAVNKLALATQTFDLQITTPNPSTVYTQQSVDVTVQAVIH